MNATIIIFKIVMNSRKDEAILYYVREQGLGMGAALLTMMYKMWDTIKTLGLFRKCLQGALTVHSYLLPAYDRLHSILKQLLNSG